MCWITWYQKIITVCFLYEACPESIQPFWISREPVAWPWCNLAASQRKHYCASLNSHTPMGLVSQQWDTVDWACVLCDCRIHNDRASRSASSRQCACPFYVSHASFFGKTSHHPGLSAPLQPRFGPLWLLAFRKTKIAVEREEICECDSRTVHKLSQRRLTADWLAPWESDCSRMNSKVSSDWLPSYIKATWPVLEIFKMAGYFPYGPRICHITVHSAANHLVHRSCLMFHISAKSWRAAVMGDACHWTAPDVVSCCMLLNLYLLLSRSRSGDTLFGWCLLYIRMECTKCMAIYFFINFVTKSDHVSCSMWIM